MLFGHGDEGAYGVSIGGTGPTYEVPRLKISQITECVQGLNL